MFVVIVALGLGMIAVYVAKTASAPAGTHTYTISTEAGPTGAGSTEPVNPFAGCPPDFTPC
jgi:hypothetical protein